MTTVTSTQIQLVRRPVGWPVAEDFRTAQVEYDEPAAMRRYLVEAGVPADRVVADHAGFDTYDSCSRAQRIFGVDRLTVKDGRIVEEIVYADTAPLRTARDGVGKLEPLVVLPRAEVVA